MEHGGALAPFRKPSQQASTPKKLHRFTQAAAQRSGAAGARPQLARPATGSRLLRIGPAQLETSASRLCSLQSPQTRRASTAGAPLRDVSSAASIALA